MKLHAKLMWVPALAAVLVMLPMGQASAHRTDGREGMQGRQLCAAQGRRQGMAMARMGPAAADSGMLAVRDLIALECLYRRDGKADQIDALYRDVLDKATQPLLRSIAYRRLARMAWRRGEHAAAEDLLKRSLQENLK